MPNKEQKEKVSKKNKKEKRSGETICIVNTLSVVSLTIF